MRSVAVSRDSTAFADSRRLPLDCRDSVGSESRLVGFDERPTIPLWPVSVPMQDAVDASLESETDEIPLSTDAVRLVKLVQGFMAAESRPQDNSPDLDRIRDAAERPGRSSIIMVLSANSPDDWNRILNVLNIPASAVPTIVIACALQPVPRKVADELDLRGQIWESCAGDQLTSCLNKRLNLGESALLVVEKDSSICQFSIR